MKAYLTWGSANSKSKLLAIKNAQISAGIDKIKVQRLPKSEIEICNVLENKKNLTKLKGEFKGIVLKVCYKGEAAASLFLIQTSKNIVIGCAKARGLVKAERLAEYNAKKIMKKLNLAPTGIDYRISARAPAIKDQYGCAIVALILV